jgi:hypothetical protein
VNRSYDALAAHWREQAEQYVRKARRSASLRDVVRLIAMASTLEHVAQKVSSGADVNLNEIARKITFEAEPKSTRVRDRSQEKEYASC